MGPGVVFVTVADARGDFRPALCNIDLFDLGERSSVVIQQINILPASILRQTIMYSNMTFPGQTSLHIFIDDEYIKDIFICWRSKGHTMGS